MVLGRRAIRVRARRADARRQRERAFFSATPASRLHSLREEISLRPPRSVDADRRSCAGSRLRRLFSSSTRKGGRSTGSDRSSESPFPSAEAVAAKGTDRVHECGLPDGARRAAPRVRRRLRPGSRPRAARNGGHDPRGALLRLPSGGRHARRDRLPPRPRARRRGDLPQALPGARARARRLARRSFRSSTPTTST